jgi:hypothetical protein
MKMFVMYMLYAGVLMYVGMSLVDNVLASVPVAY